MVHYRLSIDTTQVHFHAKHRKVSEVSQPCWEDQDDPHAATLVCILRAPGGTGDFKQSVYILQELVVSIVGQSTSKTFQILDERFKAGNEHRLAAIGP